MVRTLGIPGSVFSALRLYPGDADTAGLAPGSQSERSG